MYRMFRKMLGFRGSQGSLHGGFGDGLPSVVAQREQHTLRPAGFGGKQLLEGVFEREDAKIPVLAVALDAVQKGRHVQNAGPGVDKALIYEIWHVGRI
jgi:hypothetical protein